MRDVTTRVTLFCVVSNSQAILMLNPIFYRAILINSARKITFHGLKCQRSLQDVKTHKLLSPPPETAADFNGFYRVSQEKRYGNSTGCCASQT
jgi:hypothetical protein